MEHEGVRPDLVVLGKALGGGVYPISAVLADAEVMNTVVPGVHGSTFGGNPLACAVSIAALRVVEEEGLVARAEMLGSMWEAQVSPLLSPSSNSRPLVTSTRGRGLLQVHSPSPHTPP